MKPALLLFMTGMGLTMLAPASAHADEQQVIRLQESPLGNGPDLHNALLQVRQDAYLAFLERAGATTDLPSYTLVWNGETVGSVDVIGLPDDEGVFYEDDAVVMHRYFDVEWLAEDRTRTLWCNTYRTTPDFSRICD